MASEEVKRLLRSLSGSPEIKYLPKPQCVFCSSEHARTRKGLICTKCVIRYGVDMGHGDTIVIHDQENTCDAVVALDAMCKYYYNSLQRSISTMRPLDEILFRKFFNKAKREFLRRIRTARYAYSKNTPFAKKRLDAVLDMWEKRVKSNEY